MVPVAIMRGSQRPTVRAETSISRSPRAARISSWLMGRAADRRISRTVASCCQCGSQGSEQQGEGKGRAEADGAGPGRGRSIWQRRPDGRVTTNSARSQSRQIRRRAASRASRSSVSTREVYAPNSSCQTYTASARWNIKSQPQRNEAGRRDISQSGYVFCS